MHTKIIKKYPVRGAKHYKTKKIYENGILVNKSPLELKHQADNKYDVNAIGIYLKTTGELLGHIPKESAEHVKNLLEDNRLESATAENILIKDNVIYLDCKITINDSTKCNPIWATINTLPASSGVYGINCSGNGFVYIGESSNIKKRAATHIQDLSIGAHGNYPLQRAFNNYGPQAFSFSIIQLITETSVRKEAETTIIQGMLDKKHKLFNITEDGKRVRNWKNTGERAESTISEKKEIDDWIEELEHERYKSNLRDGVRQTPIVKGGCLALIIFVLSTFFLFFLFA